MTRAIAERLSVRCGGCDTEITVKSQFAGRTMPCPLCEQPVQIPGGGPDTSVVEPERVAAPAPPAAPPSSPAPIAVAAAPVVRLLSICSGCGMQMEVKSKYAGKFVPCPQCREPVRVPLPGESAQEVARRFAVRRDRIKQQCPACSLMLVVKSEFSGRIIACPRCRENVAVPGDLRQGGANDSGAFLVGGAGREVLESENPFDLEAMFQLASEVDDSSQMDQLWSTRPRPAAARRPAASSVAPHVPDGDQDDTGFEIQMIAAPPAAAPPVPGWPAKYAAGVQQHFPRPAAIPPMSQSGTFRLDGTTPVAPALTGSSAFELPQLPASPVAPHGYPVVPLTGSSAFDLSQYAPPGGYVPPGHPLAAYPPVPAGAPGYGHPPGYPTAPPPAAPVPLTGSSAFELPQVAAPASRSSSSTLPSSTPAPPSSDAEPETSPSAASSASASHPAAVSPVLNVECGECGRTVKASRKLAGQKVKCPQCGAPVLISGGEAPAAAPAGPERLSDTEIDLAAVIARSLAEPASPAAADRQLQEVLKSSAWKRLTKRLEAATAPGANRQAVESGRESIIELCESRDARAAEMIATVLPRLPLGLKTQALKQLGELGDPAAFSAVVAYLTDREEPLVRAAILCLSGLGDRRSVAPLVALAVAQPQQRIRALDAVVKVGEPGIPALLALLEHDADLGIQHAVLEALGRLKCTRGVSAIAPYLSHRSPVMRRHAAEMLAQIGDPRAVGALAEVLDDPDDEVRLHAAQGIARNPDPRFAERLQARIEDPVREVRLAVLQGLGACGDKRCGDSLRAFLTHEDDEFVMTAAEALGRLGDQESVGLLVERLEAIGENVEQQPTTLRLIDALRRIGDDRAALALVNLLQHPSHRVRTRCVEALARMTDAGVGPALVDLLRNDPIDEVKAAAARALGEQGAPESVETLLRFGLTEGPAVRVQTLIALGRLRPASILPQLQELLTDPSPQVRYQLADLLGELGDAAAVPTLEALAADDDEMVRRAVRRSLQQLGDTRSEQELTRALGRQKKKPRSNAASSSASIPRRSSSRRRFSLTDFVPSALFGLASLPSNLFASVRRADLSSLDAAPGGRKTLIAVGLLIAGGIYYVLQMDRGPVTYSSAPPRGYVAGLTATADGKYIAAARTRNMIEIWDVERQRVTDRVLNSPSRWAAFKGDGSKLLAVDATRVQLIAVKSSGVAESVQPLEGHRQNVIGFARSPDGNFAATVDASGQVIRWNLGTGEGQRYALAAAPSAFALSPDGSLFAAATAPPGPIVVVEFATGKELAQLPTSRSEPVTAVTFTPDGTALVAGMGQGSCHIAVWKLASPKSKPTVYSSQLSVVGGLGFQPTGALVATSGSTAEVWNLEASSAKTFQAGLAISTFASVGRDGLAVGDEEAAEIVVFDSSGAKRGSLNDAPRG